MAISSDTLIKTNGDPVGEEQKMQGAGAIVTTVRATGTASDSAFPTEQAVREMQDEGIVRGAEPAINLRPDSTADQNDIKIYASVTDGTGGSEDVDLIIMQRINGILAAVLSFDADGDIEFNRDITVNKDTDDSSTFGRAVVGAVTSFEDYAGIAHYDNAYNQSGLNTAYALVQYSDGTTYLNSAAGNHLYFQIGNETKMSLTPAGLLNVGTISEISEGSGVSVDGVLLKDGKVLATTGGLQTKNSTSDTSSPPTDAELDTAFGTPDTVGAGFVGTLDDAGAGSNSYLCWSDGTNWWYAAGTKAT